ncbi:unnamed protein product [Rotaria socialis]
MSLASISFNKYSKVAIGAETRGKTAQNRLRRVDHFVIMYCPYLIMSDEHFYVDLGFGHTPITTLESAKRFRQYNARLPILLPLKVNAVTGRRETVNLIRAFNVLRQYDLESDCRDSHAFICNYLNVNGILIEGTSDPWGRIWVANIIRKQIDHSLLIEALVFSTNFRDGFNIVSFQQVLPKNFIHRMTGSNEMIYNFFEHWRISYEQVGNSMKNIYGIGVRQQFIATAKHLAEEYGYHIMTDKKFLKNGFLIWLLKPGSRGVDIDQITYRTQSSRKK